MTTSDHSLAAPAVSPQESTEEAATGPDGFISPVEIARIAWEGVTRNKGRSLLTMLGVIIGVAAVIIMIAISAGTEATIAEQIEGLGANLVFISGGFGRGVPGAGQTGPQLVYDDMEVVESVGGIAGAVVDQTTSQTVKAGNAILDGVPLVGTTSDFPSVREVKIAQGRFFNENEVAHDAKVAVLGAGVATDLFGDSDPLGQSIIAGSTRMTVIGVAAKKGVVGSTDFDAQIYAPIGLVFDKFMPNQFSRFAGDRVRIIYAQVEEGADMDNVILQLQLKLATSKGVTVEELPFTIQTQQDVIDTQSATTEAFRSLLAWVAGVSLLVGGIGIMNIMLVSVTERTREIGIRQSVGATPNDIRLQFLTEALMLSLAGGIIGTVAGIGGSYLFGLTSDMRTIVVPSSILLAFGSAAFVGIFFGFFPANKAAQLDPIEALRHE
ncbi:MAG: ABC transporter permease [Anaerolineae bacterium]|nr:ABC transporter permease [Anaerolineae bacterium]